MARKILLADDSVTAQNMGRKILADAGYEVITVNNGSAALKKIAEHKPELIILDVYMPGYSGLEVCQRLKEAQETARVPVLLTVGKLEPFKPEEAKRVRAEGFIVKPFEASELLSVLSKLEDKIVPRAETSKPGRFARAIAAVEDQSVQNGSGEDNGWKSRISFPTKKKESPQESTDDAALYNQVNRDLRTVVQREPDGTDTTAAALPKDITTEEIAALAAAAAQIQARKAESETTPGGTNGDATAAIQDVPRSEHGLTIETKPASPPGDTESRPAEISASPAEVMTAIASLGQQLVPQEQTGPERPGSSETGNGAGHSSAEREDLPVTMAVPAILAETGGSRWTAVSVAIDAHDAAISLEQEMEKSYAAFAAAAAAQGGAATALTEMHLSSQTSSAVQESAAEPSQPLPCVEESKVEQALSAARDVSAERGGGVAGDELQAAAQETCERPEISEPRQDLQPQPSSLVGEQHEQPVSRTDSVVSGPPSTEFASGASVEGVAEKKEHDSGGADQAITATTSAVSSGGDASADEPVSHDSPAVPEALPVQIAGPVAVDQVAVDQVAPHPAAPNKEAELTATTAAAWATWRQSRDVRPESQDTKDEGGNGQGSSENAEFTQDSVPGLAAAALAVAAGAEGSPKDAPLSGQGAMAAVDPHSVASIVDSLLAELRPKIVEEISRKLAAEKK